MRRLGDVRRGWYVGMSMRNCGAQVDVYEFRLGAAVGRLARGTGRYE